MKELLISTDIDENNDEDKNYHHGDLRNALLNSALELLVSKGSEAMSLRGVARKAGVSQAAPYHHFKDKKALMAAVAIVGHERLAQTVITFKDQGAEGLAALIRMGGGYVAFAKNNPNLFRVMFGPELTDYNEDPEYVRVTEMVYTLFVDSIVAAVTVDPGDGKKDLTHSALSAWCFVHGIATLIVDNKIQCPGTEEPEFLEFIFNLFGAGAWTNPGAA